MPDRPAVPAPGADPVYERLAEAEAIIRRFHEACWNHDGDLPDEIEAAAGEALAFLGDSFRLSGAAA